MANSDLLQLTERGLYCPAGDFYVDPWESVDRAVITHAHADHAHRGCRHYLTTRTGEAVLRLRLGTNASIQAAEYGESVMLGRVRVSLHPAGHILGSAQVRIELDGVIWVVSGDYRLEPDPTCAPFEPIRCHTFVTESTFGLPIYRWPARAEVLAAIRAWWQANQEAGKASLLFGYALGKCQRLLAGLDPANGPIFTHGAVEKINAAYRASGVALPPTQHVGTAESRLKPRARKQVSPGTAGENDEERSGAAAEAPWSRAMILAPLSARGTPWTRRFGAVSTGFASGWMQIRGTRRRRAVDRGFVLSDHADWPGLLSAIKLSGAECVWVTHGYSAVLARWLREQGLEAQAISTRFEGESDDTREELPEGDSAP